MSVSAVCLSRLTHHKNLCFPSAHTCSSPICSRNFACFPSVQKFQSNLLRKFCVFPISTKIRVQFAPEILIVSLQHKKSSPIYSRKFACFPSVQKTQSNLLHKFCLFPFSTKNLVQFAPENLLVSLQYKNSRPICSRKFACFPSVQKIQSNLLQKFCLFPFSTKNLLQFAPEMLLVSLQYKKPSPICSRNFACFPSVQKFQPNLLQIFFLFPFNTKNLLQFAPEICLFPFSTKILVQFAPEILRISLQYKNSSPICSRNFACFPSVQKFQSNLLQKICLFTFSTKIRDQFAPENLRVSLQYKKSTPICSRNFACFPSVQKIQSNLPQKCCLFPFSTKNLIQFAPEILLLSLQYKNSSPICSRNFACFPSVQKFQSNLLQKFCVFPFSTKILVQFAPENLLVSLQYKNSRPICSRKKSLFPFSTKILAQFAPEILLVSLQYKKSTPICPRNVACFPSVQKTQSNLLQKFCLFPFSTKILVQFAPEILHGSLQYKNSSPICSRNFACFPSVQKFQSNLLQNFCLFPFSTKIRDQFAPEICLFPFSTKILVQFAPEILLVSLQYKNSSPICSRKFACFPSVQKFQSNLLQKFACFPSVQKTQSNLLQKFCLFPFSTKILVQFAPEILRVSLQYKNSSPICSRKFACFPSVQKTQSNLLQKFCLFPFSTKNLVQFAPEILRVVQFAPENLLVSLQYKNSSPICSRNFACFPSVQKFQPNLLQIFFLFPFNTKNLLQFAPEFLFVSLQYKNSSPICSRIFACFPSVQKFQSNLLQNFCLLPFSTKILVQFAPEFLLVSLQYKNSSPICSRIFACFPSVQKFQPNLLQKFSLFPFTLQYKKSSPICPRNLLVSLQYKNSSPICSRIFACFPSVQKIQSNLLQKFASFPSVQKFQSNLLQKCCLFPFSTKILVQFAPEFLLVSLQYKNSSPICSRNFACFPSVQKFQSNLLQNFCLFPFSTKILVQFAPENLLVSLQYKNSSPICSRIFACFPSVQKFYSNLLQNFCSKICWSTNLF